MLDRCIQILYDIFQKVYFMGGIGFPQDARRLKKSVVDARRPKKSAVDARRRLDADKNCPWTPDAYSISYTCKIGHGHQSLFTKVHYYFLKSLVIEV